MTVKSYDIIVVVLLLLLLCFLCKGHFYIYTKGQHIIRLL